MRWLFFLYIAVLLVAATNVFANDGDDSGDFFVDENAQDEIRYDLENETFSPNIQEEINNIGEFTSFTVDELKERTQAIYEEIVEIVPTVTAVIEKGQTVFAEEIAAIRETKTLPTNFSVGKLLQMPVDLIKDAFSKFLGIFTSIANLFTSMFKKGSQ